MSQVISSEQREAGLDIHSLLSLHFLYMPSIEFMMINLSSAAKHEERDVFKTAYITLQPTQLLEKLDRFDAQHWRDGNIASL